MTNSLADIVVKATPGPWFYRPAEYDDWGVVRAPNEQGRFYGGIICQARDPEALDELTLSRHRAAKTDPWVANAQLIALAPTLATLVLEAREALREGLLLAETDVEQREFELSEDVEDFDADHILKIYRDRADRFRATLAKLESL